MQNERLYTVKELAEKWKCTTKTIYRYIYSGDLKPQNIFKTYIFNQFEIDRFEKQRQRLFRNKPAKKDIIAKNINLQNLQKML